MRELSARTDGFKDSAIRRMTRVALECGAVNLSQGFPDFDPPERLVDALIQAAGRSVHQYSINWGAANVREALASKLTRFMGISIDPDTELVVTCGCIEAMMAAMMAVLDPGDKVAIFSPFYECYVSNSKLIGAEPVFVPLIPPEYDVDWDSLEDAFRQGAKALIMCNPSNPCGKVFTRSELEHIAELAEKYDTYVITDEVYEHIVFPPNRHTYLTTLGGMRERTISCSSLSKTYAITGWRLGYTVAVPEVTERIKRAHDFLTGGAPAPLQEALVTALGFEDEYYVNLAESYLKKRDIMLEGLDRIGLKHNIPQGAYYVMVDISEFGYADDEKFSEDLTRRVGVAAVPGSIFFAGNERRYIRLNFCKQEDTLREAIDRLSHIREIFI